MIDIHTVDDILLLRESEEVEFKEAAGQDGRGKVPDNFWDTYSSMANTDGGYVFLGIAEKKKKFHFAGLSSTESLQKNIVDTVNNPNKVSVNLLTNDSFRDLCFDGNHVLCVQIPRAKRKQRPVYLNNNPILSFRRLHEADQRLADEEVKRYLAEQLGESRDSAVLRKFSLNDLHTETLRSYRQLYANLHPDSLTWNALPDIDFLKMIGGWKRDRETGEEGLTKAGLLMFGTYPAIRDAFPFYMLDYQEQGEPEMTNRWVDRVTLDGAWSGNLYDFYRRVYPKLTEGLKTPFQLKGDQRIDETPVHVALREALVNTLIHADYSDHASVLVLKRPDMFRFRNPGLMRVSWEIAMQGGDSDCRNLLLQEMFRYVGLGERAGSGIPKILDGWKNAHWRPPSLYEKVEPYDQTLMELRMIDLFPEGTVGLLRRVFHGKGGRINYDDLDHNSQVALALAFSEKMVNHERLKQLTGAHSADLSRTLHHLVERHVLEKTGHSRNAVYHLPGLDPPLDPSDVFGPEPDSTHLGSNTTHLGSNTTHLGSNTTHLGSNTTHLSSNTTHLGSNTTRSKEKKINRNQDGCIIHKRLNFPVVDKVDKIDKEFRAKLERIATEVKNSKKADKEKIEKTIRDLCFKRYITISALADFLGRTEKTLRNSYLSRMVKEKQLSLAFPQSRRDKRQAYIATESIPQDQ